MKKKQTLKYLIVKGAKYKIRIDPAHETVLGECFKREKIISIAKNTKEEMQKTLLHEAIHATLAETGLDMVMTGELEELICINVEDVIWDNFFKKR